MADLWRHSEGAVLARISCQDYRYSFRCTKADGSSITDHDFEEFGDVLCDAMLKWMADGIDDLPEFPPCDAYQTSANDNPEQVTGGAAIASSSVPVVESDFIQVARSGGGAVRLALGGRYLRGDFGSRDLVSAYAWTLAAWNVWDLGGYDSKFALAQIQQYLEHLLSPKEKTQSLALIERFLSEERRFEVDRPFNPSWWGWEDDPIAAEPPYLEFKVELTDWLRRIGWTREQISSVIARLPKCENTRYRNFWNAVPMLQVEIVGAGN